MGAERQEILRLLQAGKITTEEALGLLQAVAAKSATAAAEPVPAGPEPARDAETRTAEPLLTGEIIAPADPPPSMDRYRRFWQVPFFIGLGLTILAALGLRALVRSADGAIGFWFVCVWSLFMLAFLLTALAFLSRRFPWIHVRIRERSGRRLAISLPLPLGLASWGLRLGGQWVGDPEARHKMALASDFLEAAGHDLGRADNEPLVISLGDRDGDQVHIFLG